MGPVDTDMSAWARGEGWPMSEAADVVRQALDGYEAGAFEVLGDEHTRQWRARLGEPGESLYPEALSALTARS